MNLLFDHQIFSYQKFGGISRYFFEIMNDYQKTKECSFRIGINYTENEYMKNAAFIDNIAGQPSGFDHHPLLKTLRTYRNNHKASKGLLKKGNFDLFIPTFYDPYFLPLLKGKPYCLTIFDMTPEIFPQLFSRGIYSKLITQRWVKAKKALAKSASRIISISENTKKDIVRIYGIPETKIDVIYLANSLKNDPSVTQGSLPDQYLLFVGNRTNYKNFIPFVLAIKSLLKRKKDLYVVCTGGGDFSKSELNVFFENGLEGKFLHFNASDKNLSAFYNQAIAFIFPSLYEGFEIPILEAFECGCPSVISNASCFPEIAAEAAMYFDPGSPESILGAIENILADPEKRKKLVEAGRSRLKLFSWRKTATETLETYQKIIDLKG